MLQWYPYNQCSDIQGFYTLWIHRFWKQINFLTQRRDLQSPNRQLWDFTGKLKPSIFINNCKITIVLFKNKLYVRKAEAMKLRIRLGCVNGIVFDFDRIWGIPNGKQKLFSHKAITWIFLSPQYTWFASIALSNRFESNTIISDVSKGSVDKSFTVKSISMPFWIASDAFILNNASKIVWWVFTKKVVRFVDLIRNSDIFRQIHIHGFVKAVEAY